MAALWKEVIHKIDDYRWEIRSSYKEGMRVPGLIYADENMIERIWEDQGLTCMLLELE